MERLERPTLGRTRRRMGLGGRKLKGVGNNLATNAELNVILN